MTYYIKAMGSVCYDRTGVTFPYRGGEFLSCNWMLDMGATSAWWERQFGWNNQPEVLCFKGANVNMDALEDALPMGLIVSTYWEGE